MSKDLLYRPELGYDKSYYTEGLFYDQNKDKDESSTVPTGDDVDKESIIEGLMNDLESKIPYLPDEIFNTYFPPYIGMKEEYNKIVEENKNKDDEDEDDDDGKKPTYPPIIPEDEDDGDDGDGPSFFDRIDDVRLDSEEVIEGKADIIKNNYYVDFLDIHEDYLNKMTIAIQNYIMTLIQAVSANNFDVDEPDYSTKKLKNKNLAHLSDFLIKSDITTGQTIRLHKKLFDIDETIVHIKSIRIAKEQAVRYNAIKKLEVNSALDKDSNILLQESKRVAEKKYEENFYSLYKYLNSSVILLDESLKTLTRQGKAKIIINNNEERD